MTRLLLLLALIAAPSALAGQTLAQRIAASGDGTVHLSFAARRGVCSSGDHSISIMSDDERGEWESDCRSGPVRVSLRLHAGRVDEAHTYVGGHWRAPAGRTTDLGTVSAPAAADALLGLAERAGDDAEALVMAASLADSAVVWPALLRLARREDVALETRKQAVFWLGQAAGDAAARGLDSITADERGELEVRKQAVFALSQRPAEEGVPALIHIARTSPSGELRKTALFWLGQSDDPRALALFEEILR